MPTGVYINMYHPNLILYIITEVVTGGQGINHQRVKQDNIFNRYNKIKYKCK